MSGPKKLTAEQIKTAALAFGLEYAALKAVAEVESGGGGFLPDGRPKILFEGHIFWKELKALGLAPAKFLRGNEAVLYQKWTKAFYKGGAAEHGRLEQAAAIDREAALKSASWGMFQLMGFNWRLCGYESLRGFIEAMHRGEAAHLEAALGFIKSAGLIPALKRRDWGAFAKGYNGPGYAENLYGIKLARAYAKAVKKGG